MNTKKKSIVWKYFTKKDDVSAICEICTKILKYGGNTTNLIQHLQRKHLLHLQSDNLPHQETSIDEIENTQPNSQILKRKNIEENEIDVDDPSSPSCSDTDKPTCVKKKCERRINHTFQHKIFKDGGKIACNITNSIAYMIAKDNLPLTTVENERFQHLMKTVAPLYKTPSRKTLTRLLDTKYKVLKTKFINSIQHASLITVTCDIWMDISNKSDLGITIHYLKSETLFAKGTIGVISLEKNHTSEYIKDELLLAFQSFKIDLANITAVVTDCAPNIFNAVNCLFNTQKVHIPCMAHVLAHLIPDSLKMTHLIEIVITKVKCIVTLVKRSVVASDELVRLQKRDGKTEGTILKFKQDIPTRWNSMFYMIERVLILKEYIYPVILKCLTHVEMVTREEFDILNNIVEILRLIELVTKEIGGDLYPTCSIIIPIIRCMKKEISDYIPITNEATVFKQNILSKVEERFDDIERFRILAVSTLLDPRFKKIYFQQSMAVSSAISYINSIMQLTSNELLHSTNANISTMSTNECNKIKSLWNFHDNLVTSSTITHDNPSGINVELRQHLNQSVVPK